MVKKRTLLKTEHYLISKIEYNALFIQFKFNFNFILYTCILKSQANGTTKFRRGKYFLSFFLIP